MKQFIQKNKVFLTALLSAVTLVLQQCLQNRQTSFKALSFAVLIAVIGVIANQWKGKGITILGILGTLTTVFQTIWTTGTFTWNEFLLSSAVAVLAMFTGSLKAMPVEEEKILYVNPKS
jgi:ABC-type proline/glycine betaine transport system permease subunit